MEFVYCDERGRIQISVLYRYRGIIIFIFIISVGFNIYIWYQKNQREQYWQSRNITLAVADFMDVSNNIQLILGGKYQKNFEFGMALKSIEDASLRTGDMGFQWYTISNSLDNSQSMILQMSNQFVNEKTLTNDEIKKLSTIKELTDGLTKAFKNSKNNIKIGYIDKDAFNQAVIASQKFNQMLGNK